MYNWGRENCPLYRVAGCLLFRGCLIKCVAMGFKDWRSGVAWLPEMFFMVIMVISGYHAVVLCNYHRLRMVIRCYWFFHMIISGKNVRYTIQHY